MVTCAPLLTVALAVVSIARISASTPSVWTFSQHNEAIYGWSEAAKLGQVELPATVVHFDTHGDLGLPRFVTREMSSLALAQTTEINSFILAAVAVGLVDRVVWVQPAWGTEHDYGSFEYVLAWDEASGVYKSDCRLQPTSLRDEVLALPEPVHFSLEVVPFTAEALGALDLKPRYVLDVDLDVFASENFAARVLREEMDFGMSEVERLVTSGCCEEARWMHDWESEPLKDLAAKLSDFQRQQMEAHACGTPVHYSTSGELRGALDIFIVWVDSQEARGSQPGVVTISESTDGYLPAPYLAELGEVVPRLLSFAGAREAQRLECSRCVSFEIVNDLSSLLVVLWFNSNNDAVRKLNDLEVGMQTTISTYVGHVWFFVEESPQPRYFRYTIGSQGSPQKVVMSTLQALRAGERAPAGRHYEMQLLVEELSEHSGHSEL